MLVLPVRSGQWSGAALLRYDEPPLLSRYDLAVLRSALRRYYDVEDAHRTQRLLPLDTVRGSVRRQDENECHAGVRGSPNERVHALPSADAWWRGLSAPFGHELRC